MKITNAKQAHEWISSWQGRPRFGFLKAAIDGLRCSAGLCGRRLPVSREGYEEALSVLVECLKVCFPDRIHEVDCTIPSVA